MAGRVFDPDELLGLVPQRIGVLRQLGIDPLADKETLDGLRREFGRQVVERALRQARARRGPERQPPTPTRDPLWDRDLDG